MWFGRGVAWMLIFFLLWIVGETGWPCIREKQFLVFASLCIHSYHCFSISCISLSTLFNSTTLYHINKFQPIIQGLTLPKSLHQSLKETLFTSEHLPPSTPRPIQFAFDGKDFLFVMLPAVNKVPCISPTVPSYIGISGPGFPILWGNFYNNAHVHHILNVLPHEATYAQCSAYNNFS